MNHKELAKVIVKINDQKVAEDFLENILTPQELEEISMRLEIFKMLKQEIPQRDIAEKLNVSIGKISRGSRELKYGKPGITQLI